MNRIILLLIILLPLSITAQIKFEKISLTAAFVKAMDEKRLIFLQLMSTECDQCNEVADMAFTKPFPDSLKKHFVFIKMAAADPDRITIDERFNTSNIAGTLFLDGGENLVHRIRKTTSSIKDYIDEANIALRRLMVTADLSGWEEKYQAGHREIPFLEDYIRRRKEINLPVDKLLDEYVKLVAVDSIRSARTLLFIAASAPLINSAADSVLRGNMKAYLAMMNKLPATQRASVHTGIVMKSLKKSIETRDISYQMQVAQFATWINPSSGKYIYQRFMMMYFKGIKDTFNYVRTTAEFYDEFFMTKTIEEIKKIDTIRRRNMLNNAKIDTVNLGEGIVNYQRQIKYTPMTQTFATDLNRGAWGIYKMSNDPVFLIKTIGWTEKALQFYESPFIMDTYAQLLYKTGNRDAAIKLEEKVLQLLRSKGFTGAQYERTLNKMKANAKVIDE